MWVRKGLQTETESSSLVGCSEASLSCPSDCSAREEVRAQDHNDQLSSAPPKDRYLNSRGVQVSPGMQLSDPSSEKLTSEGGRRRMMLSARRWTTKRLIEPSSASDSPGGSPQCNQHTKTMVTSQTRRRTRLSSQERLQPGKGLNSTSNPVVAGHENVTVGYSRSPLNPERAPTIAAARLLHEDSSEPVSPSTSAASEATPGWAEHARLADGASAGKPLGAITGGDIRDFPRFLQPIVALVTLSVVAIIGAKVGGGIGAPGSAVHAAGGAQLQQAVVDDIFLQADKDNNGVIADEEIHSLVEGAGGTALDDASEIVAGVASVIKHLDLNADHALSRSDLLTYWQRLGTLLTVDEVAEWVVYAVQLPLEVADTFRRNSVTGYDFPELAAKQGKLLEQDLGVSLPAHRKRLVRSMKWKLWGMGEEPGAPERLRAQNASCGALSLEWDKPEGNLTFPVHKYVLRRTRLGEAGESAGPSVIVMEGIHRTFFDAPLEPGKAYRYSLQAWNALGHSIAVDLDTLVATEECPMGASWWFSGPSSGFVVMLTAIAALLGFLYLGCGQRGVRRQKKAGWSAPSPKRMSTIASADKRKFPAVQGTETPSRNVQAQMPVAPSQGTLPGSSSWVEVELHDRHRSVSASALSKTVRPHPRLRSASGAKGPPLDGRDTRPDMTAAVESMRREQARRMISRRSSSLDDEICVVCRREWKWYRPGKHACCVCHQTFCDRCGITTHVLWGCPVGGSCRCNNCVNEQDVHGLPVIG